MDDQILIHPIITVTKSVSEAWATMQEKKQLRRSSTQM